MDLKISSKKQIYYFLLFVFLISIIGLGSWGLTESSEARYAEISREMLVDNDFVHPRLLEIQHYHKPPLTYYITVMGYKIFGLNEFGARFFLQLALLIQVFLTYKIGQILFKKDTVALVGSMIYFTFPIVLIATNNLTTDAYLTTFVISSIYFWLLYKNKGKIIGLYLSAAMLGLGFMTKGPIVFLPFIVFIVTYRFIFKKRMNFNLHHLFSILLFLLISIPWFLILMKESPELWNYFFETQTIERSLDAENFYRAKPIWYFIVFAPLVGVPWVIFFLILLINNRKHEALKDPYLKLLLFNIGMIILCFSFFSSKRILYILPVFMFIALASAYLFQNVQKKILKFFINSYKFLYLLLLLGIIEFIIIENINIKTYSLVFLVFLFIFSFFIFNSKFFKSRVKHLLSISLAFTAILIISFRVIANQDPYMINSTKSLAQEIINIQHKTNKNQVVIFDKRLSALPLYLNQNITNVHERRFESEREVLFEKNEEFKKYYWNINNEQDLDEFLTFIKERKGLFITKNSKVFSDSIQGYLNKMSLKKVNKWHIYY